MDAPLLVLTLTWLELQPLVHVQPDIFKVHSSLDQDPPGTLPSPPGVKVGQLVLGSHGLYNC